MLCEVHITNLALIEKLSRVHWIKNEDTRKRAIAKAYRMVDLIGYPEEGYWTDWSEVTTISADHPLAQNVQEVFRYKMHLSLKGRPSSLIGECSSLERGRDRHPRWPHLHASKQRISCRIVLLSRC